MPSKSKPSEQSRCVEILFLILITAAAMWMRLYLFPIESGDYQQFLEGWCATLRENGGLAAIGMEIGDYMPPYFYLLALLTYLPVWDLFAIKGVSCLADLLLAFFVMRIVGLRFPDRTHGLMAYAVVLFLPSVFLNSAAWGQCDAMFTTALAASLYYLMVNRPNRAVLAFSISFVLKLQAVFFAPLLLLLLLKKKIRLRSLILIPAVYILSVLPAAAMGRNFWDLLTVYVSQSQIYQRLCMGIPNLYSLMDGVVLEPVGRAGVFFAGGVILMLLFALFRKPFRMNRGILVTLALLFAVLIPFVLPHMHERYYYLADVLGIIFAFYFPKKFYVAVIMGVASGCAMIQYLFEVVSYPQQLLAAAVLVNVVILLKHLWELMARSPIPLRQEPPGVPSTTEG